MEHISVGELWFRRIALILIVIFFMFPIFWIILMSLQTNETILRSPPSIIFTPTLDNFAAIFAGRLDSNVASLGIDFINNLIKLYHTFCRVGYRCFTSRCSCGLCICKT